MPISDEVVLEQRSTYILPTKAGFLLGGVILLMMIGATNYQNNLAFILTFMTASIGLVSILFTFKNLQGLVFKKGNTESVCVGELMSLTIHVKSQHNQVHSTIACGFNKSALQYFDVNSKGGCQIELALIPTHRGWFETPRIMATSSFPFGLLKAWTWFKFSSPVLVYPKPIKPPGISGMGSGSDEENNHQIHGSDDLYGLKSYQPGEPISRIDWKAWAREKGFYSKEFVEYQSQDLYFCWDDFSEYDDELKLSYLCYLVRDASNNNLEFGLSIPGRKIEKNSGQTHMVCCLTSLGLYGRNEG